MRTKTACSAATSSAREVGIAEVTEQLAIGGVGPGERERDQRRGLAFAQIVADGLAGDLGVAERAEHVVAELERVAERKADRRERRTERREAVGQRGAEMQRPFDRVLARLVDRDAIGELGVGARGRGAGEIERLADAQLDAQLVEHAVRGLGHARA